jgi:hypothetical protein
MLYKHKKINAKRETETMKMNAAQRYNNIELNKTHCWLQ